MHTMQYTTLCRLQKKWTLFLFWSFLVFLTTMLILWVCLCFSVLGGHLFSGDNLCWHSVLFSWWTSCVERNGKSVFGPHWSNICRSSWWPSCIWFVHSLDLAPCRGRLLSLLLLMGWMVLAYFMPCHVCFSILTVVLRGGGLWIAAFMTITKEICKLPSFFSGILFKNLDVNSTGLVKRWHSDTALVLLKVRKSMVWLRV